MFISHTVPAVLAQGQAFPVTVTMQNTGNTAWTAAAGHRLAVSADACGLSTQTRADLGGADVVPPGGSFAFTLTLNPPAVGGPCAIDFRMIQEPGPMFGATGSATAQVVAATNDSEFRSNTLPATMSPGQGLYVGITVRNKGTKAWFTGSNHVLKAVSDPCGLFDGIETAVLPGEVVSTNANYQFIVFLTAPPAPGPCAFDLRMAENGLGDFGPVFNGAIQIAEPPNAAGDWDVYE